MPRGTGSWRGMGLDITERKRAEKSLTESEERFRSLLQSIPSVAVQGYGPDGLTQYWNQASEWLYGYSAQEAIGRSLLDLIIPSEMRAEVAQAIQQMATSGQPIPASELSLMRKDGTRVAVCSSHAIVQIPGRPLELFCIDIDLTERKQAEEALRQSRMDLDRAQEVGQIGSWRLNVRRNVLTWSDENYRIFGVPKGTPLTYETFQEIVHPVDRRYVDSRWQAGLRGEPYDFEHRIVVGQQVKWVREKAYLEFDDTGELLGGFGITQDITERKRMEEELRQSRDELEIRVQERTRELLRANEVLREQAESARSRPRRNSCP